MILNKHYVINPNFSIIRSIAFILLLQISTLGFSQEKCGSYRDLSYQIQHTPGYYKAVQDFEKKLKLDIAERKIRLMDENPEVLTIPVVFHVVWKEEKEKLPEDVIRIQLKRLNEDFNNENYDLKFVPNAFKSRIGNMNIRFVLAQTDPENRPVNGIVYLQTNRVYVDEQKPRDEFMKFSNQGGSSAWNPEEYLNIWICNLGASAAGFAQEPERLSGPKKQSDGVVINYISFGIHKGNRAVNNFGRTLTHEVGHWLGLRHIWGDDTGPPGQIEAEMVGQICKDETATTLCKYDDCVDDTPRQPEETLGSKSFATFKPPACNNAPGGIMWMNYMDYVDDLSMNLFTIGQVERARTVLTVTRALLLESKGLKPPQHGTGTFEAFRTNAFTTVAIGKDGHLWAGTDKFGLYKYDFNTWTEVTALANRDIRQIVADRNGGIWIAQSGHEGLRGIGGGLHYFETSNISNFTYFAPSSGLNTRICRGVYIDTSLPKPAYNVWTAHIPEINFNSNAEPIFVGGGIGFKAYDGVFGKYTSGLLPSVLGANTFTVKAIQGNATEVWAFDDAIPNQPQIVRYQPSTRQVIQPAFTPANTNGKLPASFFVNCFYFDKEGNKYVGLEKGGVAYADAANTWHKLPMPDNLSKDVAIHAITADKAGNFFIGTSEGLLVTKKEDLQDATKFKLMRIEDDLASDNITALAVHEEKGLLIVATDNGMTFLTKDCLLQPCVAAVPPVYYSTKNGNWNDPSVWSNGKVPECGSIVVIMDHAITAISKSQATSVHLVGATLKVENGVQFVLCQ
jgi:hypothetical protein